MQGRTCHQLVCVQVLRDAKTVDDRASAGEDIGPLCGLAVAVKELIDVAGYTAGAGTPALQGGLAMFAHASLPAIYLGTTTSSTL